MVVIRRIVVMLSGFLAGCGLAAAAWAGYDQEGRQSASTDVDESSVYVEGDSFYTPSRACVLYALLIHTTYDGGRHLESGLVRCDNETIDGTCPGGRTFIERFNGSSYYCTPGGDFNNDTSYFTRNAYADGSGNRVAYIQNVSLGQSGFYQSSPRRTYAWGEVTGGANCPTSASATGIFYYWRRNINGNWGYVNSSSRYSFSTGISAAPCWTVSGVDSLGGLSVY